MSRPQAARTSTRLGCVSPGARSGRRLTRSRRRDLPAERMAALKTATSHRSVPLWPQLREALERYLAEHPPSRLLFPSYRTGEEAMLTDFRKLLDVVAVRAGWKAGEIRSKVFRHTLLRRSAPDRGPGGAGEHLHGCPRDGPRRRGDGAEGLRSPRPGAPPRRGGGVPGGAARR